MYFLLLLLFLSAINGIASNSNAPENPWDLSNIVSPQPSPTPAPASQTDYEQALAYQNGDGVAKNHIEAFNLFLKCAKNGDPKSQYKLGRAYFSGDGVEKDQLEGLAWMYKAVSGGIPTCLCASMEETLGTEMSLKAKSRAKELFSQSSAIGNSSYSTSSAGSISDVVASVKSGFGAPSGSISADDIDKMALEIQEKALRVPSKSNNSPIYETEFLDWIKAHPTLKDLTTSELFDLHEGWLAMKQHPTGPNQSPVVARGAIEPRPSVNPSTGQSDPRILNRIGAQYEKGEGISKNLAAAAEYYRQAADRSYPPAQHNLARLYKNGEGVTQNSKTAFSLFFKAASTGNASSQNALGVAYALGQGVPKNLVRSYMWFNIAAANGTKVAARNRELAAQQMTPTQIEEAQRLSSEWSPQTQATP